MTDPRGADSAHLDAATIAAFVDRTLDPAARAAAEAHLAACADCREVWVETSEVVSEAEAGAGGATVTATEPASGAHVSRSRSRRWIYGGAGLAVAAALALAVFSPRLFDRGERPELRELVEAVGSNRRTEARLTGGFQWGPVPSATRSGNNATPPAGVEFAAAALRAAAERNPTADTLAAAGTAALTVGRWDQAIQMLEEATSLDAARASAWSDLAAAYLERSAYPNRASDVPRALDAVSRALELQPALSEAQFNKAVALERIGLRVEAIAAWHEYIETERDLQWRSEAVRRIAALTDASGSSDLQSLRERLFDTLVGSWAQLYLASPGTPLPGDIRALARQVSTPEDQLANDVVRSLEDSIARHPSRAAALAAAHLDYARAREAYRRDEFESADEPLQRAAATFRAHGHAMAFQADVYRALLDYRRQALDMAERQLVALRDEIGARPYGSATGRIQWTLGLIAALKGRRTDALRHYESSRGAFVASGEPTNAAFVDGLIATSFDRIGDPARSWEARIRALHGTDREGVLLAAAESASKFGWLHTAALFQAAAVARTRARGRLTGVVDSLRLLATTYAQLGFLPQAAESLTEANAIVGARTGAAWNRVRAELDLTMLELGALGVALPEENPGDAALAFFNAPQTASRMPTIRLARARWLRRVGDAASARSELEAGLSLHRVLRQNSPGGDSSIGFNESARGLVEEMIRIDVGTDAPARAFELLEEVRGMDLSGIAPYPSTVPPGVTAISYLVTDQETLIWALQDGDLRFVRAPYGTSELRRLIRDVTPPRWRHAAALELGSALIGPFEAMLEREQLLVIVPDGPLHSLSFAALLSSTRHHLVEDHPIVYAPSVRAWNLLSDRAQRFRAPLDVAVVGDPDFDAAAFPDLPRLGYARDEAAEVASGYPYARTPVTLDAIRDEILAGTSHVLHFAGHVLINDLVANESRLVLGTEGLSASAIRHHRSTNRQLVVLMACQSASGFPTSEGPMGLARAFLGSGVPSVVATLWPVADRHSKDISAELHRAYRASGDAPAALRASQLAMLRSGRSELATPAAWAGVIAIGGSTLTYPGEPK